VALTEFDDDVRWEVVFPVLICFLPCLLFLSLLFFGGRCLCLLAAYVLFGLLFSFWRLFVFVRLGCSAFLLSYLSGLLTALGFCLYIFLSQKKKKKKKS
jgi:hypothetical protein